MESVSRASSTHVYRIGILGPTTLSWNGAPLAMKGWGKRPPSLLRLLAASRQHRLPRDEVADLLWPDSAPDAALTNLRGAIHRLRQAAEPGPAPVVLEGGWVTLNPECTWVVDLGRFDELTTSHEFGDLEEAAHLLRGEPLIDDRYEDWASPVRDRIESQWKAVCLRLIDGYTEKREFERAIYWSERLLERDPLDEAAVHRLLLALDALGRRTEAVQRYHAFARLLQSELGAPVAAETEELAAEIERREHEARAAAAAALHTREAIRVLPFQRPRQSEDPPKAKPVEAEFPAAAFNEPKAVDETPRAPRSASNAKRGLLVAAMALAAAVVLVLVLWPRSTQHAVAGASAAFVPVAGWAVQPLSHLAFQSPIAIAAGSDGDMYVADQTAGTIDKLSPSGSLLSTIKLSSDASFLPGALAVDDSGRIFAIDGGNASVRVFAPDGALAATYSAGQLAPHGGALSAIGADGRGHIVVAMQSNGVGTLAVAGTNGRPLPGYEQEPYGGVQNAMAIAVDPDSNTYVLDGGQAPTISEFSPGGSNEAAFGLPSVVQRGANSGLSQTSLSLAAAAHGTLYLAVGGSLAGNPIALVFRRESRSGAWKEIPVRSGVLSSPSGITLDPHGAIYVADTGNRHVIELDGAGRVLATWGVTGPPPPLFSAPAGVTIDHAGAVYAVDSAQGTITELTSGGRLLRRLGGHLPGKGRLSLPQDIAVDASGNIYVADMGNNRVLKLRPDGSPIAPWGDLTSDTANLLAPTSLALDHAGNLWVLADGAVSEFSPNGVQEQSWQLIYGDGGDYFGGLCVDVAGHVFVTDGLVSGVTEYTSVGKVLHAWGGLGALPGEFRAPASITVDAHGNLFVADTGNDRIQELSPNGAVLHVFGVPGSKAGQFAAPAGIAVDSQGDVYVADVGNHRVQKLKPGLS